MIAFAREQYSADTTAWSATKRMLEAMLGIENDSMHVLIGTIGFLFVVAILRSDCRSFRAWLIILAFALANEIHDILVDPWPELSAQFGEGAKDLILTMAIPTILVLLARFAPGVLVKPRAQE